MTVRRNPFTFSWIAVVLLLSAPSSAQTNAGVLKKTAVRVDVINCKCDGQIGLRRAPKGAYKLVMLNAQTAKRLSYYKSEHTEGILAPRDWHCFETYGSNGATLFISPQPINKSSLVSQHGPNFSGPIIEVSQSYADTSGRFEVAQIAARIFPAQKEFVQQIIDEKIEPASNFKSGPYPKDKLIYLNSTTVEYHTPANSDGLGTVNMLRKNSQPIDGVVMLALAQGWPESLTKVTVRLTPQESDLCAAIIGQFKREHEKS